MTGFVHHTKPKSTKTHYSLVQYVDPVIIAYSAKWKDAKMKQQQTGHQWPQFFKKNGIQKSLDSDCLQIHKHFRNVKTPASGKSRCILIFKNWKFGL